MPIGRGVEVKRQVPPDIRRKMWEREQEIVRKERLFFADFWNSGPFASGCIAGVRAMVFGFKPRFRRTGLPILLYWETEQAARKLGYKWCELSWNLEDNDLINKFDSEIGGKVYKRYRIYEREL